MRDQIAAGNWKMNLSLDESKALSSSISKSTIPPNVKVILGVPFPYLSEVICEIKNRQNVFVSAQDCSAHGSGAYTGEVSALMLNSIGVSHTIIGHSERRQYHREDDELLLMKTKRALDHGIAPIFCCGEPLEIREHGSHVEHVKNQLLNSVLKLSESEFEKIVIAYEPIWAIGTGKTATPEQAQDMHSAIRNVIRNSFGELADNTSILYGGSVKPSNANEIFSQLDVDGGLVGGASLNAESFIQIINSF